MADVIQLVEFVARALVDDQEAVDVVQIGDTLELSVAEPDRGKVIGRKGRTAHAIRVLLAAAATGNDPVNLDVVD